MSMGASGFSLYPPSVYFPNIKFNNDFYAVPNNGQGITLNYANTHYLFSTGSASSSALTTFFSGSIGIGTPPTGIAGDLQLLTLTGNNINALLNLQENGQNLSSKYLTIANASSNYQPIINTYTISGATGGSMSFASGTLTLTMPTSYTSLSIASLTSATSIIYKGFEISATYQPIINTYTISGATGGSMSFASGTLTLTMPTSYTSLSIASLTSATSIIYKGFEISAVYDTISARNVALTSYSTTGTDPNFLLKTGGTMTGSLSINTSVGGQEIVLTNTNPATDVVISLNNNVSSHGYLGIGGTNDGSYYANNMFLEATNSIVFNSGNYGTNPKMILLANGNVGIGITNPNNNLSVNGGIQAGYANGVSLATVEAKADTLTTVFSGDTLINSFWGIAMNIIDHIRNNYTDSYSKFFESENTRMITVKNSSISTHSSDKKAKSSSTHLVMKTSKPSIGKARRVKIIP